VITANPGSSLAAAATVIIVFAAGLLRQVGVPKLQTMWAEDGRVFLQCAYDSGGLACLGQPYQGYLHLVPRAIAIAAGTVSPGSASAMIAILAALVAAGAAAVAGRSIADATASPLAGLLGGVGLALVWQAGREILGNTANLHWILFAATSIAIVCSWLGAPITRGTILLAGLAGLTSPFSPFLALASAGAVAMRRSRAWLLFTVAACTAVVQGLVEATSNRESAPGTPATATGVVDFLWSEVIRRGFFGPVPMPAGLIVPVLITIALVSIVWVVRDREIEIRAASGVAFLVGIGFALCVLSIVLNPFPEPQPRYAYPPTAMMVAALALAGGYLATGLARGSPRARSVGRVVMPAIALLVGVGFALSFRLQSRASAGPDVPAEIVSAAEACPIGSFATIPIAPSPATTAWFVRISCSRLAAP